MYNKFTFPGLINFCSIGMKNEGNRESLDDDEDDDRGSVKNSRCVVVSSSYVGTVPKNTERKDQSWCVKTSAPSDLTIKVGDSRFHLHKLPMVSRSGYLNRMVFQRSNNGGRDSNTKLQIDNIPGGAQTFESIVKFCYGQKIDLTPSNAARIYCASNFLEMTEDFERGNLMSKAEAFLSFLIFSSWKDTFRVLKSCEPISYWAKEYRILQRCAESIASKALKTNPIEAVSSLRIDHFVEVIQSMKSKGVEPSLVGLCIARWTNKWLHDISSELESTTTSNPKNMTHQLQRVTIECLIRVIPKEENSVARDFLLWLLKVGLVMQTNEVLLETLEQRIVFELDQFRECDLLVKNYGCNESVYDVKVVSRVVRRYITCVTSNLIIRPKLLAVGRLVDGYLMLVARDEKLNVKIFQSLIEVLPKDARYCDDNLYRATDMYLKAHPGLTDEDRRSLCGFLEYSRLSKEAREHVMKNNRLPLECSTKFILLEKISTTKSKPSLWSNYQRTKTGNAIVRENSISLRKVLKSSRNEIKDLTMEVETMKSQLNDLQKCKLRLQGKLKRCRV